MDFRHKIFSKFSYINQIEVQFIFYSANEGSGVKDESKTLPICLSDKKILVNGGEKNVRNLAENLEFEEVAFKVKGKEKEYLATFWGMIGKKTERLYLK